MLLKRDAELDLAGDALELETLYPRRPERPQPNPLALTQYCLNQVPGTRVAVVGAGLAGLMAARLLCQYGIRVSVYEAYKEVGGRVRSNKQFSKARITEEGAELIGSFHTKWLELAREYGLAMISRMDPDLYQKAGLEVRLILEHKPLTMPEFLQFEDKMKTRVLKPIAQFARQILDPTLPWRRQPRLKKYDGMSVQEALTKIFKIPKRTKEDALLWKMIEFKLVNDEVAPLDKMNFLGLLCKVRAGQGEHFGVGSLPLLMRYWDELEIFRCADGCQQLAKEMEKEIKQKCDRRVYLNTMVKRIDISKDRVRLTWVPVRGGKPDPGPGQSELFDSVILAIPPSVWKDVTITVDGREAPLGVTPGLMRMRPAVKFFSDVTERFWIKEGAAPYGGASTLGQVWEGTDNQTQVRGIPDPQHPEGLPWKVEQGIVLSVFAGPILSEGKVPAERDFTDGLRRLYRRYEANPKTHFSNWPKEPFIEAGYASPEPNQIFTIGRKLSDPTPEERRLFHDRLFFAGEHTDMAFFGYMEGALRSGEQAAKAVMLKKCGLTKEPALGLPSRPLVARAGPSRENAPSQQEGGIASEAKQGWEELEEDQSTRQPDEDEDAYLKSEGAPLSEREINLQWRDARKGLYDRGSVLVSVRPTQNILFIGAERGDEFKDAMRLVCQGPDVIAIGPRKTASAKAFRHTGGRLIRARIEDLPREARHFDLIRESLPYPSERHYSLGRSFALARLSRLRKGGRWILVTESPRYASLLKAVGDYDEAVHRNFTVTASSLASAQAPSKLDPHAKARFRLIFQRWR